MIPAISSDFNPRSREGSDSDRSRSIPHKYISIHAPAKGATFICIKNFLILYDFNPRSREGSDNTTRYVYGSFSNFNPRSREGSDNFDFVL